MFKNIEPDSKKLVLDFKLVVKESIFAVLNESMLLKLDEAHILLVDEPEFNIELPTNDLACVKLNKDKLNFSVNGDDLSNQREYSAEENESLTDDRTIEFSKCLSCKLFNVFSEIDFL